MIVHENYGYRRYQNDIALLRLSEDVETTDYIQPICLPSTAEDVQFYWAAGWGQIGRDWARANLYTDTKLKAILEHVNFTACAAIYATRNVTLGGGQMCAGGKAGKDTCRGDSGGPLMRTVGNNIRRWIVEGVVSFGCQPCGEAGWSAVYTKVHSYVDWIVSKLEP